MRKLLIPMLVAPIVAALGGCAGLCTPENLPDPTQRDVYRQVGERVASHLRQAERLERRGELLGALSHYEKAHFFDPGRQEARAGADRLRAQAERRAEYHFQRGMGSTQRDKAGALKSFNQALHLRPDHERARQAHTALLRDPEMASLIAGLEQALRSAFRSYGGRPEEITPMQAGVDGLLAYDARNSTALEIERAVERDRRRYVDRFLQTGHSLIDAGRVEPATEAFRQVQAIDPDNDEARESLRKLQQQKDLLYFINLARYRLQKDDSAKALEYAAEALAIDGENPEALALLVQARTAEVERWIAQARESLGRGEYVSAVDYLQKALDSERVGPETERVLADFDATLERELPRILEAAQRFYEAKRFEESLKLFEYILRIDPENSVGRTYAPKINYRLKTIESLE